MEDNRGIDFVAKHYRKSRFKVRDGWRRLGIVSERRWLRPGKIAVGTAVVAIGATAAVFYHNYSVEVETRDTISTVQSVPVSVEAEQEMGLTAVRIIDFEEAPLNKVIECIDEVYGVKVVGLPDDADNYRLSLHYEGTALDLVETINDILGTHLECVEN